MRDGLCHLAGSHLLDPATGEYTLPYLDRVLGPGEVAVVRLVHREQGLLVAPGNPLGLAASPTSRRAGLRYVNRQRGAGTRVLLDHELAPDRRRRTPSTATSARSPPTWRSPPRSPPAAPTPASASARPPRAFGLDFVPVAEEPYDLVIPPPCWRPVCWTRCSS